jgi:hypothetical protein
MHSERKGIFIASVVALLAIFAVGTGAITGGFTGSAGSPGLSSGLAAGVVLLAVFLVAAIAVLKSLVPEGLFHQ